MAVRVVIVCVTLVLGLMGGACGADAGGGESGNGGSGGGADPFLGPPIKDYRCKTLDETVAYGDDPRPECETLLRCIDCCAQPPCPASALPESCEARESRLVWREERRACAPTACPAAIDEARDQPCGPEGHVCPFPGGVSCHCWKLSAGPTWFCGDYKTAGCPEAGIPDVGTPCTEQGLECIGLHIGACDVPGEPARQCIDGTWQALEISQQQNGECI